MNIKKAEQWMLYSVIALGIIAKIISIIFLPQSAYNDALFHVFTAQQIINTNTFFIDAVNGIGVPPPFFYSAIASVFVSSGINLNVFSAKLFSTTLVFLQIALAFVLFKKIFPDNFLSALAFFVIFPWVSRFTGVSYPESLTIVFVLAGIFLLVLLSEKKSISFFETLPPAIVISAMSLSKLNGTILVPSFLLSFVFLFWAKKTKKKSIAAFALLTLFFSSFWFGLNFFEYGKFDQHLGDDIYFLNGPTGFSLPSLVSNSGLYYLYFWDFPNQSAFLPGAFLFGVDFFSVAMIFLVLTLPLFMTLVFGAKNLVLKKNFIALLVFFSIILAFIPVIQRSAYYRLIIPAVPFFAMLFGFGHNYLKGKTRLIVAGSLAFFCLFSVAYTSVSAYSYYLDEQANNPLFTKISGLTEKSVVLIPANLTREVEFVLGKKAVGVSYETPEFLTKNSKELHSILVEKGISHIAVSCRKNPFDLSLLKEMVQKGFLEKIFENDCSKLFEVKK